MRNGNVNVNLILFIFFIDTVRGICDPEELVECQRQYITCGERCFCLREYAECEQTIGCFERYRKEFTETCEDMQCPRSYCPWMEGGRGSDSDSDDGFMCEFASVFITLASIATFLIIVFICGNLWDGKKNNQ